MNDTQFLPCDAISLMEKTKLLNSQFDWKQFLFNTQDCVNFKITFAEYQASE